MSYERARSARSHRALTFMLAAIICCAALAGVYAVAVRTAGGQRLDDRALEGREHESRVVLRTTGELLDTISVEALAVIGGGICVIALLRRRPHLAFAAATVIVGANVTTQVLKRVVLTRPDFTGDFGFTQNSFPSGHTTVAMSIVMAAVLVVSGQWRIPVAFIGTAYAAAIGVAVLVAGWHRPSDAIGAYLVVGAWTAAASAVLSEGWGRITNVPSERDETGSLVGPAFELAGLAALVLAFGALATAQILGRGRLSTVDLDATFAAAAGAVAGTAVLLVGALLLLLRGLTLDAADGAF